MRRRCRSPLPASISTSSRRRSACRCSASAGTQERVDLAYLWPSLAPPDPARKPSVGAPVDPNERLFVTISSGDGTLPLIERVQNIYPRYLVAEPKAGPDGLTLRGFRDGTPYQGEELVFESAAPEHFLARCSLHGVVNSGECLLERRIGNADITDPFSARLADRLAQRRRRHRQIARAAASELTSRMARTGTHSGSAPARDFPPTGSIRRWTSHAAASST